MTYTPFPVWPRPSDEGGGVTSHGALTGRSSTDQHPIGAITGLQDALDGAGGAAAPEVFRSDFYVGMPFADINGSPSITDGVLTWIEMAGSEHPLRIMLDDPVLGADRGIWIANEDLLNPGTNDGTFTFAPTEQQPYASLANSGLIGSFGLNVAGRVQYLTGSSVWEFRDFQTYLNADSDNWPGNDPATFSQALDQLAAARSEVYFAYQLINEADLSTEYEGSTFNSGVSISDLPPGLEAGARIVVVPTDPELLYQSFVTDGTTTAPYEDPQISTFAKNETDLGGQSVLLNVFYDAVSEQPYIVNTTYLMFGPSLIPQSWSVTG
jgi:hypothetical protein